MRIAFVCSGNTCRSPLAEAAWRAVVAEFAASGEDITGLPYIHVESVGLWAAPGERAASFARRIARDWGTSLDHHRSQLFSPSHTEYDLLLTMTRDQAQMIRSHFGLDRSQVRLLGSYAPRREARAQAARIAPMLGHEEDREFWLGEGDGSDILDPYGGSMEAYSDCATQIYRAVSKLARSLTPDADTGLEDEA